MVGQVGGCFKIGGITFAAYNFFSIFLSIFQLSTSSCFYRKSYFIIFLLYGHIRSMVTRNYIYCEYYFWNTCKSVFEGNILRVPLLYKCFLVFCPWVWAVVTQLLFLSFFLFFFFFFVGPSIQKNVYPKSLNTKRLQ